MIELTQARELLRQAMETKGRDFIYSRGIGTKCAYEVLSDLPADDPRSTTACLVGVALTLAGETEHLKSGDPIQHFPVYFPKMMTEQAARYFAEAQTRQDQGSTWGEAFDRAEASLN